MNSNVEENEKLSCDLKNQKFEVTNPSKETQNHLLIMVASRYVHLILLIIAIIIFHFLNINIAAALAVIPSKEALSTGSDWLKKLKGSQDP